MTTTTPGDMPPSSSERVAGRTSAPAGSGPWLAAVALLVGGLGVVVGSVTTWMTVRGAFFSASAAGTDPGGDGWITLALGVVLIAVGAVVLRRWWRPGIWAVGGGLVAIAAVGMGIFEIVHITTSQTTARAGELTLHFTVSVGAGLIVLLAAAAVAAAGAGLNVRAWRRRSVPTAG